MPQAARMTSWAECATCPECQKILVLDCLPPECKRPSSVSAVSASWAISLAAVTRGVGRDLHQNRWR